MNTERLRAVIEALRGDIAETDVISGLKRVIDDLANSISAPNEAHSNALTNSLNAFYGDLDRSISDRLPKTWFSILETIPASKHLGKNLRSEVEEVIAGNQLTPANAQTRLTEIHRVLQDFDAAGQKLQESFDHLGIEASAPEYGEGELSLLVPELAIDSELAQLANELKFFDQMVQFFSEVSGSGREPTQFRQISTTDPFIAVGSALGAVLLALKIVREIQKIIEGTQKIKIAREAAVEAEMNKKTIDIFDTRIREFVIEKLDDTLKDLVNGPKKGRSAELRNEGKKILEGMARRIDNGFQFDGDAQEQEDVSAEDEKVVEEIRSLADEIRHISPPDETILNLPPPIDDDGHVDDSDA